MKKATFKVGDKVYCPEYFGTKIHILESCGMDGFPLQIDGCVAFNQIGKTTPCLGGLSAIFHATPENHTLLEKLYSVKFEAPPAPKNPKEIIQAMLDDGWYLVNYRIYGKLDNPPKHKTITKAQFGQMDNSYFNKNAYMNVEIFDPKTGKTIIDYIDGKIVTE